MIIAVDTDAGTVRLDDPDTFTAFSIEATGSGDLGTALAGVGRFDGEHGWFSRAEILRLAGDRARDEGWLEALDGMIAFAVDKGFADDGGAVRAHVERG